MSDSTNVPMPAPPLTGAVHPRDLAPEPSSSYQGQTSSGRAPNVAPRANRSPDHPDHKRRTTDKTDAPFPLIGRQEPEQSTHAEGGGAKARAVTARPPAPAPRMAPENEPPPPVIREGHARVQPARIKSTREDAFTKMRITLDPRMVYGSRFVTESLYACF